jgi:cell division protein FtsQ
MAAKRETKASKVRSNPPSWRFLATFALFTAGLMGAVFGIQQLEQFLIRDPRFMLAPPAEYGEESPNLHVDGVQHASRRQVLRVFQPDIGRSLYLLPLADRRNALRKLPWVKDATVTRTWPNNVSVKVVERQPVAFVQLPADSMMRWALIDADGIILDPPDKTSFKLPVITGVRGDEAADVRSLRVRRMRRMLDDLGELREKVSDVDVADLDDLKITTKLGNHAVILRMGDHNFRTRFQNFLDNYDEIQKHNADMNVLDLRLDDRITVLGGRHG